MQKRYTPPYVNERVRILSGFAAYILLLVIPVLSEPESSDPSHWDDLGRALLYLMPIYLFADIFFGPK